MDSLFGGFGHVTVTNFGSPRAPKFGCNFGAFLGKTMDVAPETCIQAIHQLTIPVQNEVVRTFLISDL